MSQLRTESVHHRECGCTVPALKVVHSGNPMEPRETVPAVLLVSLYSYSCHFVVNDRQLPATLSEIAPPLPTAIHCGSIF